MTIMRRLGTAAALACAATLTACGQQAQPAQENVATNSAAPAQAGSPAGTATATPAAPARAGATIPATYHGVWATHDYSCPDEQGSGRFKITANTVLDNFHDLYEVTNVESRGGGIVVLGGRDGGARYGRIEQTYRFVLTPDGRTLTYTDRNNIETAHTRCPTAG